MHNLQYFTVFTVQCSVQNLKVLTYGLSRSIINKFGHITSTTPTFGKYHVFILTNRIFLQDNARMNMESVGPKYIEGHDLDLSRSRDVIGHVTTWFSTCNFLLVVHWNRAFISKRFRDIRLQTYLGHDLDLLGVTWYHGACDHLIPSVPFPIGAPL